MEPPKPCEHQNTVISTTGGIHFSAGHIWDDQEDCIVCLDCGKELYPGIQPDLSPAELAEQLALEEV